MNLLSTMHSHSTYCDGKNTLSEMAKAAYDLGFVSFGFSSHSHLPYKAGYEMKMEKEKSYREEALQIIKEYDGKMEILLGLELDADSVKPDFKYDFLISSVHQLHTENEWYAVDDNKEQFERLIKAFGGIKNVVENFYSQTVTAALRENIDIVGHIDLVGKFNENNDYFNPNDEWYLKLVFGAIDAILEKRPDIVFEVNTGAISRGYRITPYPDLPVLKYLGEKGARIMVNSDTHAADTIDYAYDIALDYLKKAGIKTLYRLRKFGFEEIAI